jgi:hypothetical protein
MSAFNTQTPGKYPEDNLSLQQQHGESLKTRIFIQISHMGLHDVKKIKRKAS